VDVHRVRQLQPVCGACQSSYNLSRRDAEILDWRIKFLDRLAADLLPVFDATGIDNLKPGAVGIKGILVLVPQMFHHKVIVAEQQVEAFIQNRRVLQFLVSMAGMQSRNGSIHGCRVTNAGKQIAGGEGAGHNAACSRTCMFAAINGGRSAFQVRCHFATRIDFRTGNMTVHIDAARHHNVAGGIQRRSIILPS